MWYILPILPGILWVYVKQHMNGSLFFCFFFTSSLSKKVSRINYTDIALFTQERTEPHMHTECTCPLCFFLSYPHLNSGLTQTICILHNRKHYAEWKQKEKRNSLRTTKTSPQGERRNISKNVFAPSFELTPFPAQIARLPTVLKQLYTFAQQTQHNKYL